MCAMSLQLWQFSVPIGCSTARSSLACYWPLECSFRCKCMRSNPRRLALIVSANVVVLGLALGGWRFGGIPAWATLPSSGVAEAQMVTSPSASPSSDPSATASPSPPAADAAQTSPSAAASPSATDTVTTSPSAAAGVSPSGGPRNIVLAMNRTDSRLAVRGGVRLDRIPGQTVSPGNSAIALASCTSCNTFAVALQIALYSKTATVVTPQNSAVAVNSGCNGCTTEALAYQFVLPVDDPTHVPPDVQQLIGQMNATLNTIQANPDETLADAEAQVNAVVGQFQELADGLSTQRDVQTAPTTPNAPQYASLLASS